MNKNKVKPCSTCGVMPEIEYWSSGGLRVAVRCNNPGRPDSCDIPFYYSINNNPDEAVERECPKFKRKRVKRVILYL